MSIASAAHRTTREVKKNADGSVDLYFGPKAPPQGVELGSNRSGANFEVMFRLYAPTQAFFDKKGKLGDIEVVE